MKLLGLLVVLGLVGCGSSPIKTRTETVEVFKPVLYCPSPNWNELDRPSPLAIKGITPQTSAGEVAKFYTITIIQLQEYITRLEKTLQQYDDTNQAYEELRKQFFEQQEMDGFQP